jgi:hypothetical protein
MIEKLHSLWPIQSLLPTAQQRYTSSTAITTGTASAATQGIPLTGTLHGQNNNNINVMQAQSSGLGYPPTNLSQASLWVVFGIKDRSGFNDIENIKMSSLSMNDVVFFKELKRIENNYRWTILGWFSPYIFTYCKFVQVRIAFYFFVTLLRHRLILTV